MVRVKRSPIKIQHKVRRGFLRSDGIELFRLQWTICRGSRKQDSQRSNGPVRSFTASVHAHKHKERWYIKRAVHVFNRVRYEPQVHFEVARDSSELGEQACTPSSCCLYPLTVHNLFFESLHCWTFREFSVHTAHLRSNPKISRVVSSHVRLRRRTRRQLQQTANSIIKTTRSLILLEPQKRNIWRSADQQSTRCTQSGKLDGVDALGCRCF